MSKSCPCCGQSLPEFHRWKFVSEFLEPTEWRIFKLLLKRRTMDGEAIFWALYADRPEADMPKPPIVRQYIHRLRRKLEPHGFQIVGHRYEPYRLVVPGIAEAAE